MTIDYFNEVIKKKCALTASFQQASMNVNRILLPQGKATLIHKWKMVKLPIKLVKTCIFSSHNLRVNLNDEDSGNCYVHLNHSL